MGYAVVKGEADLLPVPSSGSPSSFLWFPFEANEGQRVGQDLAPALLQNVFWSQSPSPDKDLLQ